MMLQSESLTGLQQVMEERSVQLFNQEERIHQRDDLLTKVQNASSMPSSNRKTKVCVILSIKQRHISPKTYLTVLHGSNHRTSEAMLRVRQRREVCGSNHFTKAGPSTTKCSCRNVHVFYERLAPLKGNKSSHPPASTVLIVLTIRITSHQSSVHREYLPRSEGNGNDNLNITCLRGHRQE